MPTFGCSENLGKGKPVLGTHKLKLKEKNKGKKMKMNGPGMHQPQSPTPIYLSIGPKYPFGCLVIYPISPKIIILPRKKN